MKEYLKYWNSQKRGNWTLHVLRTFFRAPELIQDVESGKIDVAKRLAIRLQQADCRRKQADCRLNRACCKPIADENKPIAGSNEPVASRLQTKTSRLQARLSLLQADCRRKQADCRLDWACCKPIADENKPVADDYKPVSGWNYLNVDAIKVFWERIKMVFIGKRMVERWFQPVLRCFENVLRWF